MTRSADSLPLLVVATLNAAKGREIQHLLADIPFRVATLGDIVPGATLPEETGDSYRENALLKAREAAALAHATALADDSGLEVAALGGGPGIFSARFGGPGLDDRGRTLHLLERLRGVPPERRGARYRCVIAIVTPEGVERVIEGVVEGVITEAPRGTGGFGYDPVFYYTPLGRTFGELAPEEKARVSHRALAVRAARTLLL